MDNHTRWDEDHRAICQPCYEAWLEACDEMTRDEELDLMSEGSENE